MVRDTECDRKRLLNEVLAVALNKRGDGAPLPVPKEGAQTIHRAPFCGQLGGWVLVQRFVNRFNIIFFYPF
jgi:hypothetical protein